ncbi:MAG TPA: 3-deoxy-7-phosphoheptulonate synthase [Aggregatilineales bacterium]|nr:3-deoxy-7-phosphoheptulonate synthase [Aggregatilineales bacterium]
MIVIMRHQATASQVAEVIHQIEADGYRAHITEGDEYTIIGAVGHSTTPLPLERFELMEGVDKVVRVSSPYKLASRDFHPKDSHVPLNGSHLGGKKIPVIAGPCSVESRQQIIETACAVKEAGATALRGGAFKPRTSPYAFQGHGEKGLQWLAEAREVTGLPIVTEVMEPALVPMVCQYADVLQIGARNMQNFALLNAAGASQHTVLIKRGMSSTIEDLLMAAEYVLSHGNNRVILCERGIRTFETFTRNTFDLNAIPALKHLTHVPVIADPSHAIGKREYVTQVALGAVASGADGLIIEVHHKPDEAMSDGRQSLTFDQFADLMRRVRGVAQAVDRTA